MLAPDPAMAPGLIIQFPPGKPLITALPVDTEHVGCVMVPAVGALGVTGCAFIITFAERAEVHPAELVTVYA